MSDEEQLSGVNWKWFGILAGTVFLVGVATYFLLPSLISKTETDMTIVKALEEPFKVKPMESGGRIVDHQDLLVVDILRGGTRADNQTESLRPAAPNPEPPPISVIESASPKMVDKADRTSSVNKKTEGSTLENDGMQKKAEKNSGMQPANAPKAEADRVPGETDVKKTAVKEEKFRKTIKSRKKKRVIVIEGDAPLYMIQLAAFRSAGKAAEMAKILSQKHKIRLKNMDLETMKVDTGSNGVFHRIVSALLPRQDADKMCGILRRSGQDCFVRKYIETSP